jgi:hypothetical protein
LIVAASALENDSALVTSNIHDDADIPRLKLLPGP